MKLPDYLIKHGVLMDPVSIAFMEASNKLIEKLEIKGLSVEVIETDW